jgi:DNA mismatch endonuclease, patch repair protein
MRKRSRKGKLPDVHDKATRSRNMAAIRAKDTKPERIVRSALHRAGFRFRLHRKDLPGKPDILMPKYSAVIFVNGCFWHGHDCGRFRQPGGENAEFWREKIDRNRERDERVARELEAAGWRVLTVWECAIEGPVRRDRLGLVAEMAAWIQAHCRSSEIAGIEDTIYV